jgi:inward rectifier potassium channel
MNILRRKKFGAHSSFIHDLYYIMIKASWGRFFIFAGLAYLVINFIFAGLYYFSPAVITNVSHDSLWELFLFSFQTSTTIGYGYFLPQSNTAHIIVLLDAMSGIFYAAIITGLSFSKFARPNAKVLFSNKVIFTTFDGKPAIMFRLANGRDTHIIDANINISALVPYETKEGLKMRRYYSLKLLSDRNPTFTLSWTAIYVIKDDCPLKNLSLDDIKKQDVLFTVSFTGIDEVLSQPVHTSFTFRKDQFVRAKKFKDILNTEQLNLELNMKNFHEVET